MTEYVELTAFTVEETEAIQERGQVKSQNGLMKSTAHYKNLYDRIEKLKKILKQWKKNNNASAEKFGIPEKSLPTHKVRLHWRTVKGKVEKSLYDIQREKAEGNPVLMRFLDDAQRAYDEQPADGAGRTLVVKHNPDYKPRA